MTSEPTADRAVGAPNPSAAGRPAADEKRTAHRAAQAPPAVPAQGPPRPQQTGNEYGEACLPKAASRSTGSVVTMGRNVKRRSARRTAAMRALSGVLGPFQPIGTLLRSAPPVQAAGCPRWSSESSCAPKVRRVIVVRCAAAGGLTHLNQNLGLGIDPGVVG